MEMSPAHSKPRHKCRWSRWSGRGLGCGSSPGAIGSSGCCCRGIIHHPVQQSEQIFTAPPLPTSSLSPPSPLFCHPRGSGDDKGASGNDGLGVGMMDWGAGRTKGDHPFSKRARQAVPLRDMRDLAGDVCGQRSSSRAPTEMMLYGTRALFQHTSLRRDIYSAG